MTFASLESLSPELQAQIMRNLDAVSTLYSLLRASPRFYQVFRSRKEYLLTQLAFQQFHPDIIHDVWNLAKASQIPQPADRYQVWEYLNLLRRDDGSGQVQIPLSMIISLCKLIPSIGWFIQDYRRRSLEFLANFVTQLELKQDSRHLYSDLSAIEAGRIQRAFCRLETFRYLFAAAKGAEINSDYFSQAQRFLNFYAPDEVEEIACIRDYLIRRLWDTFESIEDDALQEDGPGGPIQELGQQRKPHDWFSPGAKVQHLLFMEYLVSQGLPFLQKVFESDGVRRAELVIPNSWVREDYISDVLTHPVPPSSVPQDFDAGSYDGEGEFVGDDLDALSQGLLWANRDKVPSDYGRRSFQGLRQWGYLFWDKKRLQASGVLDKECVLHLFTTWVATR
ncbi:MAG: hypothetical protein Q9201_002158 [Fulgogasparrea decipioides]